MAKFLFIEFVAAFSANDDETSNMLAAEETRSDKKRSVIKLKRKTNEKLGNLLSSKRRTLAQTINKSESSPVVPLREWIRNQSSLNSFCKVPSLIKLCIDASLLRLLFTCRSLFYLKILKHEEIALESLSSFPCLGFLSQNFRFLSVAVTRNCFCSFIEYLMFSSDDEI